MRQSRFSKSLIALSCFGLLLGGSMALSGCLPGKKSENADQKESAVKMEVREVDQLSQMGNKTPDGQYIVARVSLKNTGNKNLTISARNFNLQNITDDEKERYSQPLELGVNRAFMDTFGKALKDKLLDNRKDNLYPRMEIERYFVFMVPSNAKIDGYQIVYVPEKVSAPLVVTGTTVINDHRNSANELP